MVSGLRDVFVQGQLDKLNASDVRQRLNQLMQMQWVVYSKPYLQHPETVVKYLSRYTHRIAISDFRLIGIDNGQVRFTIKDYRGNKDTCMRLNAVEFIRRSLRHVLPQGFMRVRHYGFLSNRVRQQKLAKIRNCINAHRPEHADQPTKLESSVSVGYVCPKCRIGRLCVIGETAPQRFEGW